MKYPKEQYQVLVRSLEIIGEFINLQGTNNSNLHFLVYQQFSGGQSHNKLVVLGNPIIKEAYDFELYPEGCDDNHIETAVRKAISDIVTKA